jgi:hypothetical protein
MGLPKLAIERVGSLVHPHPDGAACSKLDGLGFAVRWCRRGRAAAHMAGWPFDAASRVRRLRSHVPVRGRHLGRRSVMATRLGCACAGLPHHLGSESTANCGAVPGFSLPARLVRRDTHGVGAIAVDRGRGGRFCMGAALVSGEHAGAYSKVCRRMSAPASFSPSADLKPSLLERPIGTQTTRYLELLCRAAVVLASIWMCLGSPAANLLNALVPAQRVVYAALMPEFSVGSFGVEQVGPHSKLRVSSVNTRYIVVRGRAYAPGIAFDAETPARAALVYAALIVCGAALTVRRSMRAVTAAATVALLASLTMAIVSPSVLLAGAQWGVAFAGFEDLCVPAILVGASAFLVHGGGYALCAAAIRVAWFAGRRARAVGLLN